MEALATEKRVCCCPRLRLLRGLQASLTPSTLPDYLWSSTSDCLSVRLWDMLTLWCTLQCRFSSSWACQWSVSFPRSQPSSQFSVLDLRSSRCFQEISRFQAVASYASPFHVFWHWSTALLPSATVAVNCIALIDCWDFTPLQSSGEASAPPCLLSEYQAVGHYSN